MPHDREALSCIAGAHTAVGLAKDDIEHPADLVLRIAYW